MVWFDHDTPMLAADLEAWRADPGITAEEKPTTHFIARHWHPIPGAADGLFTCDQFDPEARLCLAHDSRPEVCRGYPWYGTTPADNGRILSRRCSFWADVPAAERPRDILVDLSHAIIMMDAPQAFAV